VKYALKNLGEDLIKELDKGFDVVRIANWARTLFFYSRYDFSPQVEDVLKAIYYMEAGPEFEYSENELKLLSLMLLNEDVNAVKKINSLKTKEINEVERNSRLENLINNEIEKHANITSQYLKDPDNLISKNALELNEYWLMCPECLDGWESVSYDPMVICPKCKNILHNPRYKESS